MAKRRNWKKARRAVSGFAGGELGGLAMAAIYGAARPYVARTAAPVINKIPVPMADSVVLGGAAYLLGRFGKNPILKNASRAILISEAFIVGSRLSAGMSTTTADAPQQGAYDW
jgi:hypothetical protein